LPEQKRSRVSLQSFLDELFPYVEVTYSTKTQELSTRTLGYFRGLAGNVRLGDISAKHIDRYKVNRRWKVKPVSVNIELP
jgi:hypothetical protein